MGIYPLKAGLFSRVFTRFHADVFEKAIEKTPKPTKNLHCYNLLMLIDACSVRVYDSFNILQPTTGEGNTGNDEGGTDFHCMHVCFNVPVLILMYPTGAQGCTVVVGLKTWCSLEMFGSRHGTNSMNSLLYIALTV